MTALDCKTLKTLWQVRLPRPPPPAPEPPRASRGTITPPRVKIHPRSAADERSLYTADLAFPGDGKHLAVLYGRSGSISVDVRAVYALSGTSGEVTALLHGKAVPTFHAHRLSPVPGRPAVVALSVAKVRRLVGEHSEAVYFGAFEVSLAPARVTPIIEISRSLGKNWEEIRAMTPHALAVMAREVQLAPDSFGWVRSQKITGAWPTGEGQGVSRA